MRTTLLQFACLLIMATLAVACTRDRATPEATGTPVTLATSATTPSSAEPAVETTAGTTPAAQASDAEDTPEPDSTPTRKTFDYQVKAGDTLAEIAVRFDASLQSLRELNFLLDDNIFAGQVLAVPYIEGMTAEGAPTPTPAPYRHVVAAGDTLTTIAILCGIDNPISIVEANNLTDANNLMVGMELLVPGCQLPSAAGDTGSITDAPSDTGTETGTGDGEPASTSTGGGESITHVVQPGETLLQIATEYGIDLAALARANGITNGNLIRAGQQLIIPGVTRRQALEARGTRYVVQSGESLSVIAQKYGVTVEAIMAANGVDDPNTIVVGQELLIPPAE